MSQNLSRTFAANQTVLRASTKCTYERRKMDSCIKYNTISVINTHSTTIPSGPAPNPAVLDGTSDSSKNYMDWAPVTNDTQQLLHFMRKRSE